MTAEDVMNMCERGECSLLYGDFLLMRDRLGRVWVSLDGYEWTETDEPVFINLFNVE